MQTLTDYGLKILALLNAHPALVSFLALGFLYQVSAPLLLAFDKQLAKLSPGATAFLRASGLDVRRAAAMINRALYFLLRRYVPAIPPPPEVDESERKAKTDPPPPTNPPVVPPGIVVALFYFAAAVVIGVVSSGCAEWQKPLDDAAASVRAASVVAERSEPCLFSAYQAETERCKALPNVDEATACVERARDRWDDVRESLAAIRRIRCQVDPAECIGQ